MVKTLTILLLTGPFSAQYVDFAFKIIEKALNRGYYVNLFLYGEGVHVPRKGQASIQKRLAELIDKGLKVKACVSCALARGYVNGDPNSTEVYKTDQYVHGVAITSLFDFSDWIRESDRVLSFGD
ncbi:DsrE family protein [Candidatus Bathyarchaeota archaeon]|nr:DsrE family protein [Candidatus Bathyarchaeota archaeon]